jgi:hypothetical protein
MQDTLNNLTKQLTAMERNEPAPNPPTIDNLPFNIRTRFLGIAKYMLDRKFPVMIHASMVPIYPMIWSDGHISDPWEPEMPGDPLVDSRCSINNLIHYTFLKQDYLIKQNKDVEVIETVLRDYLSIAISLDQDQLDLNVKEYFKRVEALYFQIDKMYKRILRKHKLPDPRINPLTGVFTG